MKKLLLAALVATQLVTGCYKNERAHIPRTNEPIAAEKPGRKVLEKDKADSLYPAPPMPLSADFEAKLAELVKPAQEALLAVLEKDETGIFDAYKKDIKTYGALKDEKQRAELLERINERYYKFAKEAWFKAGIDERYYKNRIIELLPDSLREHISFADEFLNFKVEYGGSRKPDPPPAPAPELTCVGGVNTLFEIPNVDYGLSASGWTYTGAGTIGKLMSVYAASYPPGGGSHVQNTWATDITIPGTFREDNRLIKIRKAYKWTGSGMAFSAGWVAVCDLGHTSHFWQWDHFVKLVAPLFWYVDYKATHDPVEHEEVVEKRYLYNIRYGLSSFAAARTMPIGSAIGYADLQLRDWSVCEIEP